MIVQLPPGTYTVSAELVGFRKSVRKGVAVNVGTRVTLGFDLAVGNVSEQVEVSAEAALVETTRSDISGVVTPKEIESLPLIDRTFAGMAVIMPEARPAGTFDPTKTRLGNFAMNGGDGRQLDVNVDGGDNKDNAVGGLIQNFAYESIQEFQVLQHRWSAESGRAVGGVVNVITKSGTNDFRVTAFGTYRNQDTRAKNFFEKQPGRTRRRSSSAGSTAARSAGPVVKDKLFFFGALERFDEPSHADPGAGERDPAARGDPVGGPGRDDPEPLRRHARHLQDRLSPGRQPFALRALRLPGPEHAERPDHRSRHHRPHGGQHEHDQELRLRGAATPGPWAPPSSTSSRSTSRTSRTRSWG